MRPFFYSILMVWFVSAQSSLTCAVWSVVWCTSRASATQVLQSLRVLQGGRAWSEGLPGFAAQGPGKGQQAEGGREESCQRCLQRVWNKYHGLVRESVVAEAGGKEGQVEDGMVRVASGALGAE